MTYLRKTWDWFSPLTRGLVLFLLTNVALNLFIWKFGGLYKATVLSYTRAFLHGVAGPDSWAPMRYAFDYLDSPRLQPLYSSLMIADRVKFQYPPTSLLFLEPLRHLPYSDYLRILNTISWYCVLAILGLLVWTFLLSVRRYLGVVEKHRIEIAIWVAVVAGFALTFHPLIWSFRLGQIQTWIDALFCLLVVAWMYQRKGLAGVAAGVITVIHPQLGLLFVWGLLRKQWRFAGAGAVTVALFGLVSLARYGLANHLDYVHALSFLSQHGETFYANQSVNGLLNRVFCVGGCHFITDFWPHGYPPFHPVVYAGTIITTVIFIALALFWRMREHHAAELTDLFIASVSFTVASPIAWEHHYGILLPMFAVTLPMTMAAGKRLGRSGASLLVAYLLSANFFNVLQVLAASKLNVLESYLFFGVLVFLVHLYRLRHVQQDPGWDEPQESEPARQIAQAA